MLKTAESVTPKHPDKMCDQISDAILDEYLKIDPKSRVAIETMGGHGNVYICGEVTAKSHVDHAIIKGIVLGITGKNYATTINIVEQSPEIAEGVDTGGAGDQGIMVGYATDENAEMIPEEVRLSRSLAQYLFKQFPFDGKTQITIDDETGKISAIVASFQNVSTEKLYQQILQWTIDEGLDDDTKDNFCDNFKVFINPAGDWKKGGFDADTGLTGRKLVVDNYGSKIPIGGGCFSGKDGTKVDRSGAYMARKVAVEYLTSKKNCKIIGNGIQDVLIRVAYSIGIKYPVEITAIINYKEGQTATINITEDYRERFAPQNIIKELKLDTPIFLETAKWGHFGHNFNWE